MDFSFQQVVRHKVLGSDIFISRVLMVIFLLHITDQRLILKPGRDANTGHVHVYIACLHCLMVHHSFEQEVLQGDGPSVGQFSDFLCIIKPSLMDLRQSTNSYCKSSVISPSL
jgi:hypothetical protein